LAEDHDISRLKDPCAEVVCRPGLFTVKHWSVGLGVIIEVVNFTKPTSEQLDLARSVGWIKSILSQQLLQI
jgi:hypothetical protein